jgi:hypothetical protein
VYVSALFIGGSASRSAGPPGQQSYFIRVFVGALRIFDIHQSNFNSKMTYPPHDLEYGGYQVNGQGMDMAQIAYGAHEAGEEQP